jgi:hypothetical protein
MDRVRRWQELISTFRFRYEQADLLDVVIHRFVGPFLGLEADARNCTCRPRCLNASNTE